MPNDRQVVLRVPSAALKAAEGIRRVLERRVGDVKISRSAVLRQALLRGLEELERESKKSRP